MNIPRTYLSLLIGLGLALVERQVEGVPISWIYFSTVLCTPSMPIAPLLLSTVFVDICLGLPLGLTALVCGLTSAIKRVLPHQWPLRVGILLIEGIVLAFLSHSNIVLTCIIVVVFGILRFESPNVEEIGNAI